MNTVFIVCWISSVWSHQSCICLYTVDAKQTPSSELRCPRASTSPHTDIVQQCASWHLPPCLTTLFNFGNCLVYCTDCINSRCSHQPLRLSSVTAAVLHRNDALPTSIFMKAFALTIYGLLWEWKGWDMRFVHVRTFSRWLWFINGNMLALMRARFYKSDYFLAHVIFIFLCTRPLLVWILHTIL